MGTRLFGGGEYAGGLDNVVCSRIRPFDIRRVSFTMNCDGVIVHVKFTVLGLDGALESAMHLQGFQSVMPYI